MSERKVQNKYFPPEYDYRRTPKAKRKSGPEQWKVSPVLVPLLLEPSSGLPRKR